MQPKGLGHAQLAAVALALTQETSANLGSVATHARHAGNYRCYTQDLGELLGGAARQGSTESTEHLVLSC